MMRAYIGRLLKTWEWRTATLSFALICAEAMVVALVASLIETPGAFSERGSAGIPPLAVVALLLLAATIPRVVEAFQLWSPDYEVAIGVGVVISLVGMVYVSAFRQYAPWDLTWLREAGNAYIFHATTATTSIWLVTIVVVYAWARGRLRDSPALDSAYVMLRIGAVIVAVTAVLIVTSTEPGAAGRGSVKGLVIGFFFFSLSAISIARLQMEGLRSQGKLGPQWLGPLVLPVALVLLVGLLAAAILSHTFLQTVATILHPLFVVLNFILEVIIAVISWIAYLFYLLLSTVVNKITGGRVLEFPKVGVPPQRIADQTNQHVASLPDWIRYTLLGTVLAIIVYILTRFLFRRPARQHRGTEERESVMDWNEVGQGLKGMLANLMNRLRRKGEDPFAALRGDPRWQHTIRIRTLYLRLLHRARRAGTPRKPSEAPREYVPQLETLFPQREGAILTLTDVYRAARYSDRPATADAATAAERAFTAITESSPPASSPSPADHGS
jgi:hypothetical protein